MTATMLGLFLVALGGGDGSNDLVSWIDAEEYFRARRVEVTPARMLEVAGGNPAVEGPFPVNRLLAIRWLGEHPDGTNKDARVRQVLQRIAEGGAAGDPQGFARDYARRALALLDGKPAPVLTLPDGSLRADALAWFPDNAVLAGGFDFRPPPGLAAPAGPSVRTLLARSLSDRDRKDLDALAEVLGNVRVDRISFALLPPPGQGQPRLLVRVTGLADRKRLADFLRVDRPGAKVKEEKGPRGEPITLISSDKEGAAAALLGDNELLFAFTEEGREGPLGTLREALRVRAGRRPSVLTGPLAARLKKVPARAFGLLAADIPEEIRAALAGDLNPFGVVPRRVVLEMTRERGGVALRWEGRMGSAEDARKLAKRLTEVKRKALEALEGLPRQLRITLTPRDAEVLRKTIEGGEVQRQGATVLSSLFVGGEAIRVLRGVVEQRLSEKRPPAAKPGRR